MIKKDSMKAIKAMRQAAVTVTAAVALALTGCTGQEDFIDGGDTPAKGVTLTMTASISGASSTVRAPTSPRATARTRGYGKKTTTYLWWTLTAKPSVPSRSRKA